jgi:hypothetical protein
MRGHERLENGMGTNAQTFQPCTRQGCSPFTGNILASEDRFYYLFDQYEISFIKPSR